MRPPPGRPAAPAPPAAAARAARPAAPVAVAGRAGVALALLAALAVGPAAPAAADPLVAAVRAEARRLGPEAFERATEATDRNGRTVRRVERFEPQGRDGAGSWTLVSVDGRTPTEEERRRHAREVAAAPPPGYWRLATLLSGPFTVVRDPEGRTVHRFRPLAPGSIRTARGDISSGLAADVWIEEAGGRPVARAVRIYAPEPFSLMGVARMNRFEASNDYGLDPGGRPRLVAQSSRAEVRAPVVGTVTAITRQTYRPL